MKNSIDNIGTRTRDLLACSAVSQPTALPRAPYQQRDTNFYVPFFTVFIADRFMLHDVSYINLLTYSMEQSPS